MTEHADWPALDYADWAPTKKTLHMCAQMLGKARLPWRRPNPSGCTPASTLTRTASPPDRSSARARVVTMGMDVFGSASLGPVERSPRDRGPVGLDRSVADIWADFQEALAETAGLEVDMWEKPQETTDATPFSENTHDRTVVPEQAQSFHRLLCSVQSVLEEFRSEFFGRTAIPFWWGSFDLAVLLFTGKHETAPDDRGYIMRYDLDAEHMNAGFWPGTTTRPTRGSTATWCLSRKDATPPLSSRSTPVGSKRWASG